jgi:hypothetical protein
MKVRAQKEIKSQLFLRVTEATKRYNIIYLYIFILSIKTEHVENKLTLVINMFVINTYIKK